MLKRAARTLKNQATRTVQRYRTNRIVKQGDGRAPEVPHFMVYEPTLLCNLHCSFLLRRGHPQSFGLAVPRTQPGGARRYFLRKRTEGRQHHRRRAVCTQEPPFDIRAVAKKGDALRLHHHQRNDVDRGEDTISGGTGGVGFPAAYQRFHRRPGGVPRRGTRAEGSLPENHHQHQTPSQGVSRKWRPRPVSR